MSDDTGARLRAVQSKMARFAVQKTILENREALSRIVSALSSGEIQLAKDGLDFVIQSLQAVRKDLG